MAYGFEEVVDETKTDFGFEEVVEEPKAETHGFEEVKPDPVEAYGFEEVAEDAPPSGIPEPTAEDLAGQDRFIQHLEGQKPLPDYGNDVPDVGRSALRLANDASVATAKTVVGTGEALVGLSDLLVAPANVMTGGRVALPSQGYRMMGYDPERTQEFLDTLYSRATRDAKQQVADADGILPKIKEAVENPSTIATAVGESAGPMLLGAGQARTLTAAKAMSPQLAAALGEALITAGGNVSQITQANEDHGITAKQAMLATGSAGLTGIISLASGNLQRKLGIDDVDVLLAGGKSTRGAALKNPAVKTALSAFFEGVVEELPQSAQEQISNNIAEGKPWNDGLDDAAAMGLLSGMAMGLGGGAGGTILSARQSGDGFQGLEKSAPNPASPEAMQDKKVPDLRKPEGENFQPLEDQAEKVPDLGKFEGENFQGLENETGEKLRGFSDRVSRWEGLDSDQQKALRNSPESYYTEQHYDEMGDIIEGMSRAEKLEAMLHAGGKDFTDGNHNLGVMAGLSIIQEDVAAGKDPQPVIAQLTKRGTTIAQLLAQFRLLPNVSPEFATAAFEKGMAKDGLHLRDAQRNGLNKLFEVDISKAHAAQDAARKMRENPTTATVDAYKAKFKVAQKSKRQLMNRLAELSPKSVADQFRDQVRGNLLVLKSHKRNLISNVFMMPILDSAQTVAAVVDSIDTFVVNQGRKLLPASLREKVSPRERQIYRPSVRGSVRGIVAGTKRAAANVAQGSSVDDTLKGEAHRGFRPLSAWKQLLRNDLPVNASGRVPARVRVSKLIEGTLGIAPEINFRMLNFADDPFKYRTYHSFVEMAARDRKLKGNAKKAFIENPPATIRTAAMEQALTSVFQEHNKAGTVVSFVRDKLVRPIPVVGQWMDAAVVTPVIPFVATPANVSKDLVKLAVPNLTLATGTAQYIQGRRTKNGSLIRRGEMNMGYALVGATIAAAGTWLLAKGVISNPHGDDDKENTLLWNTTKPGRFNQSSLRRILEAQASGRADTATDREWQDGDTVINLQSLGFPGAVMSIQAAAGQLQMKEEKQRAKMSVKIVDAETLKPGGSEFDVAVMAVREGFEQSFLRGVSGFLEAIKEGKSDALARNYFGALSSSVLPNSLAVANRARQKYLPDMRISPEKVGFKERTVQALKNAIAERNPFIDWEEAYPWRRTPLGEPILRTPEGVPAFMHHLWSDSEPLQMDPAWREIRKVYSGTKDGSVIPSMPVRGSLRPPEYERLLELVGEERMRCIDRWVLNSSSWDKRTNLQKAQVLKRAYSAGSEIGRKRFKAEKAKAAPPSFGEVVDGVLEGAR